MQTNFNIIILSIILDNSIKLVLYNLLFPPLITQYHQFIPIPSHCAHFPIYMVIVMWSTLVFNHRLATLDLFLLYSSFCYFYFVSQHIPSHFQSPFSWVLSVQLLRFLANTCQGRVAPIMPYLQKGHKYHNSVNVCLQSNMIC